MQIEIISPERVLFRGNVDVVSVPGALGAFTILKSHAPIVSVLQSGVLAYGTEDSKQELRIEGGFLEASGDKITICVEQ